jgi:hypothetical protein
MSQGCKEARLQPHSRCLAGGVYGIQNAHGERCPLLRLINSRGHGASAAIAATKPLVWTTSSQDLNQAPAIETTFFRLVDVATLPKPV